METDITMSDQPPRGTVRLTLSVEGQVALSRIVEHWTKDEAAALIAGDREARDELITQAIPLVVREGNVEVEWVEVWADGNKLDGPLSAPVIDDSDAR